MRAPRNSIVVTGLAAAVLLGGCGGKPGLTPAQVKAKYSSIVLGIDHDEQRFQQNLTQFIDAAKKPGSDTTQKDFAAVLQPLYDGVNSGITSLSQLPVPASVQPDMRQLVSALGGVSTSMQQLVLSWPNVGSSNTQLQNEVAAVNRYSALIAVDLRKTAKSK